MLYIFDVDNTLTPPREAMDSGFAGEFTRFCTDNIVYLVSGSDRGKLDSQLPRSVVSASAGIFSCAGSEFETGGQINYQHDHEFPDQMIEWLDKTISQSKYPVQCGRHIEYRTGTINVSTIGRAADKTARQAYQAWDQVTRERASLCRQIEERFADYEAFIGGEISIDISPRGWNKSRVAIVLDERHGNTPVTFVGDGIYPGGNDWPLAEALRKVSPDNVIVPVGNWLETVQYLGNLKPQARTRSA